MFHVSRNGRKLSSADSNGTGLVRCFSFTAGTTTPSCKENLLRMNALFFFAEPGEPHRPLDPNPHEKTLRTWRASVAWRRFRAADAASGVLLASPLPSRSNAQTFLENLVAPAHSRVRASSRTRSASWSHTLFAFEGLQIPHLLGQYIAWFSVNFQCRMKLECEE